MQDAEGEMTLACSGCLTRSEADWSAAEGVKPTAHPIEGAERLHVAGVAHELREKRQIGASGRGQSFRLPASVAKRIVTFEATSRARGPSQPHAYSCAKTTHYVHLS